MEQQTPETPTRVVPKRDGEYCSNRVDGLPQKVSEPIQTRSRTRKTRETGGKYAPTFENDSHKCSPPVSKTGIRVVKECRRQFVTTKSTQKSKLVPELQIPKKNHSYVPVFTNEPSPISVPMPIHSTPAVDDSDLTFGDYTNEDVTFGDLLDAEEGILLWTHGDSRHIPSLILAKEPSANLPQPEIIYISSDEEEEAQARCEGWM